MKTPWATMAIPLSITSSKSGGCYMLYIYRTVDVVLFLACMFSECDLKYVSALFTVTLQLCLTAALSGPSAP